MGDGDKQAGSIKEMLHLLKLIDFKYPFRWTTLRSIGSLPIVKSGSAFIAAVGYIILLSEDVREWFAIVTDYKPSENTIYHWVDANRWELMFFGFMALTLGSLLFNFCPKIIKRFADSESYASADREIYSIGQSPAKSEFKALNDRLIVFQSNFKNDDGRLRSLFPKMDLEERLALAQILDSIRKFMWFPRGSAIGKELPLDANWTPFEDREALESYLQKLFYLYWKGRDPQKTSDAYAYAAKPPLELTANFQRAFDQKLSTHFGETFANKHLRSDTPLFDIGMRIYQRSSADTAYENQVISEAMQADFRRANKITFWSYLCGGFLWSGIILLAIPTITTVAKVVSVVIF